MTTKTKKIKPNRRAEIALRRAPFEAIIQLIQNPPWRGMTVNRAMKRRIVYGAGGPKV